MRDIIFQKIRSLGALLWRVDSCAFAMARVCSADRSPLSVVERESANAAGGRNRYGFNAPVRDMILST